MPGPGGDQRAGRFDFGSFGAGNASAVFGCVQFFVSGLGGMGVSLLHNGTALPMAGLICFGAAAALVCNLFAPASAAPVVMPVE